ncbi:MAG: DUF1929 domain-containing protein [Armatimonadota bacterium]|nr:DUF1929 domain-containing protein [Armatimonadota bacterium]
MKTLTVAAGSFLLASASFGQGSWTNVPNWPTADDEAHAIHMNHLRPANPAMGNKGRFLFWEKMEGPSQSPYIWNPYSGGGTFTLTATGGELDYMIFCCGQTLMKNGKVIACGSGFENHVTTTRVSVFDPLTDTWSTQAGHWMNQKRYYPSVIRMPYGEIVVAGGQAEDSGNIWIYDNPYEVQTDVLNANNAWVSPSPNDYYFINYPQLYAHSASEVFFAGSARRSALYGGTAYQTFLFTTSSQTFVPYGGESRVWWRACSAMIRPGLIFKCGGFTESDDGDPYSGQGGWPSDPPASVRSEIFNLASDVPWTQKTNMNHARLDFNLVLLPDGTAMAVGGSTKHSDVNTIVRTPEIYDLTTNTWTDVANHSTAFRGYHSSAALMPDGRVVLAGADLNATPSAEIYTPTYCTNGTRPNIVTAPDVIQVGVSDGFPITVNDAAVNGACLIALGSMTHGWDSNQRYIPLTVNGTGTSKSLSGVTSVTQTPLGWYMLFVTKPAAGGGVTLGNLAKYVYVDIGGE